MKETKNMACGMSYRTMNGIDTSYIMSYLEGNDQNSSTEILKKNREYYIASANKTISRLELAKKGAVKLMGVGLNLYFFEFRFPRLAF
jgi:hypothetical protein